MNRLSPIFRRLPALLAGLTLALCGLPGAWAVVQVDDLYRVERPVTSQAASERRLALSDALAEVLVRLAGREQVARAADLTAVLAQPRRYIRQYQYYEKRVTPATADAPARQLMLRVDFDPQRLRELLERNGLTVWGQTRPATLLWLAVEENNTRYVLADGQDSPLRELVMREARRRGLALLLPLMDLEDQSRVRVADIWGGFVEPVREASRRYQTETVAIARVWQTPQGAWNGRWSIYLPDKDYHWQTASTSLESAVASGMDGIGDVMVSRYGLNLAHATEQPVEMVVSPLSSVADYARILKLLSQLEPVTAVTPRSVEGGRVRYALRVRGGPAMLQQALSISTLLTPASPPPVPPPVTRAGSPTATGTPLPSDGGAGTPPPGVASGPAAAGGMPQTAAVPDNALYYTYTP